MKSIAAFVHRNPWVYVVLAFALLIGAWSTLITIAVKHSPPKVEVRR
jgi:hypothetical protein